MASLAGALLLAACSGGVDTWLGHRRCSLVPSRMVTRRLYPAFDVTMALS